MRASFARVFARIGGAGCVALAAAAALPCPVLAQTGPLTREEVVVICEAGDAPTCTNTCASFTLLRLPDSSSICADASACDSTRPRANLPDSSKMTCMCKLSHAATSEAGRSATSRCH